MASTLKRTIYTHSGVQVSPKVLADWQASTHAGLWGQKLWDWDTNAVGDIDGLDRPANNAVCSPKTVQNATMTLNVPRADVNVFGVLGVVDRPQLEAETATLEFSFIPEKRDSVQLGDANSSFYPTDIQALISDAIAQDPLYVSVWADGVGEIDYALMNSLSGEATIGALPTFTMGYTGRTMSYSNLDGINAGIAGVDSATCLGSANACPLPASQFKVSLVEPGDIDLHQKGGGAVNDPGLDEAQGGNAGVTNPNLINEAVELAQGGASGVGAGTARPDVEADNSVNPDIDLGVQTGCAQSASFAWDLPVETLLCLGANPKHDGVTLGNPPGTSSFTVEALSLQLEKNVNAQNYNLRIGIYNFQLVKGAIDSRTHNLAVGDLFGSYNYVIGGTADGFNLVNIPGSNNTNGMGLSLDGS
jgi:hypothetical protein